MRSEFLKVPILCVVSALVGCGSQSSSTSQTGTGGKSTSAGGSSTSASGGAGATGGIGISTGGTSGTGGTGGGSAGSGGNTGVGGAGSGGRTVVSTGGAVSSGGTNAGSGGNFGGAGAGSGGRTGLSTGGTTATGSGGLGSGGNTSGSANGGATGAVDGSALDAADNSCPPGSHNTSGKQYCSAPSSGTAVGSYTYDLWQGNNAQGQPQGSGCITVYGVDATFKAEWTGVADWIARVGLSFDKTKTYDQLGTFSSDFGYTMTGVTSGGFGNIGIYGWTVNPLHEYYIAENWLGKKPNFTKVGSFTIDGEGTYDVMTNQQKNAANITGTNQDFVQFWSVRTSPRQCGHISISKHFAEWASLGLQLGNLEETRLLVEGQNNSGTIDFTTATVVVSK